MADTDIGDEVLAESPELLREQAVRRLKTRREFHSHVFVYLSRPITESEIHREMDNLGGHR